MKKISVELNTGTHCIEFAAKNEFRKITGILLSSDDEELNEDPGEKLELLRDFIADSDFNSLRGSDTILSGEVPGVSVITRNMSGLVEIKSIRRKK